MNKKCKKYRFNLINMSKFQLKYKYFAFFLFIFVLMFLYLRYLVMPLVVANTETQIKSYATKSVNLAIANTINQKVSYGDIVNVVKLVQALKS